MVPNNCARPPLCATRLLFRDCEIDVRRAFGFRRKTPCALPSPPVPMRVSPFLSRSALWRKGRRPALALALAAGLGGASVLAPVAPALAQGGRPRLPISSTASPRRW